MHDLHAIVTAADAARPAEPRLERVRGEARLAVKARGAGSAVDVLYQSGAMKFRLPRTRPGAPVEAVLLNTAGGITGGDRLACKVTVADSASALVTTQAAERIYRRSSGTGVVETNLAVGAGASLDWLPQETILFDRSALVRRLDVTVAATGTLLALEAVILGRRASGEAVREVSLADSWRIRRAGRLVFADAVRLDGDTTRIMAGGATGKDASAFATLVLVGPDAEARLDAARAALSEPSEGGASAWNGMLVARLVARDGQALRQGVIRLVESLRGKPMPRVWNC